ncbi:hypothetical protein LOD99_5738 [Oopsacas minuta]|uniref:Uncharacterized protein n=1 Tax=Oopsacas minuta TaxID=111878 RepID=A0AAV7JPV6_9METZ|nr:hypothetical protein LOD99_5738 [Oopsacas minuta]
MFPNRGQLTTNTDLWGMSPPIGAYSIRYRQVQENFAKELEERKKEEKKRISERFRFNAEETLRRQKDNREKRKAFEAAEEKHRKEVLNQRKLQQRQVLTQARTTASKYYG